MCIGLTLYFVYVCMYAFSLLMEHASLNQKICKVNQYIEMLNVRLEYITEKFAKCYNVSVLNG